MRVKNWEKFNENIYKPTYKNIDKREKILLGGHEMWLDREKLMLYDKEYSQNGIGFDVAGEGDGIYILSQHLTKDEKQQLANYLKSNYRKD